MSSILFSDHSLCQLMADKAMLEPKYKSQLERSASGRFSGGDELIEKNMTESRHKLLMLERINNRNKWHWGRIPKEYQESIARISAGRAPANSRRALTILAGNQRLQRDVKPFSLLRLPLELRQQIYIEALEGTTREIVVKSFDSLAFKEDYPNRHFETFYGSRGSPHWKNPVSRFETATPHIYGKDITTGLLLVSKSVYSETVPILYQSHSFDFGIDVFGIVPFLRKMTPLARASVRSIHMEKYNLGKYRPWNDQLYRPMIQHQWHLRENTHDWKEACAYIATNLQLKELSINVNMKGGKPTDPPLDSSGIDWVKDLVQIRGLQKLSYHISPHLHGLQFGKVHSESWAGWKLGPDDIVDGDVEGAKPGLGRLFRYLRGEMLKEPTTSALSLEG